MKRTLIAAAAVLLVAAGCGDSEDEKPATSGAFVKQLNRLCQQLEQDVLAVVKDERYPTAEEYLALRRQTGPLFAAFDAKVAAIEVTDDDKSAAEAFEAYRVESDKSNETLVEAASTGDEGTYRSAFAANDKAYDDSKAVAKLTTEGIYCPAR